MDQELYDYSPITERPPLRWPDGKRSPSTSASTSSTSSSTCRRPAPGGRRTGPRRAEPRLARLRRPGRHLAHDRHARPARDPGQRRCSTRGLPPLPADHQGRRANATGPGSAHGKTNSILQTGMDIRTRSARSCTEITPHMQQPPATARRAGWARPDRDLQHPGTARRARLHLRHGLDQRRPALPAERARHDLGPVHDRAQRHHPVRGTRPLRRRLRPRRHRPVRPAPRGLRPTTAGSWRWPCTRSSSTALTARYLARALQEISERADVWLTTSDAIADHYIATREDT